jgi:hypothetical protein
VVRLTGATEGSCGSQDWPTFELGDIGLQPSSSNRQRI